MWDRVAVGVGRRVVQGGLGIDRGVFCARRWRVLPVIPRIGVKGHQACDFREFRSPGSAWRKGKQEGNFLAQNLLFVHLCASKINAGICVSFSLSFTALHVFGVKLCESDCLRNWPVSSPWRYVAFRIVYRVVAVAASKCVFYHHLLRTGSCLRVSVCR